MASQGIAAGRAVAATPTVTQLKVLVSASTGMYLATRANEFPDPVELPSPIAATAISSVGNGRGCSLLSNGTIAPTHARGTDSIRMVTGPSQNAKMLESTRPPNRKAQNIELTMAASSADPCCCCITYANTQLPKLHMVLRLMNCMLHINIRISQLFFSGLHQGFFRLRMRVGSSHVVSGVGLGTKTLKTAEHVAAVAAM